MAPLKHAVPAFIYAKYHLGHSAVQLGAASTEIGCTRVFGVGSARMHEQLVALDDAAHRL